MKWLKAQGGKIMDRMFVELYKRVNMDAVNEVIDSRMRGIESVLKDVNNEKIDKLVKIYVNRSIEEEDIKEFGNYFYNEDYSFEMDNYEELSILAGYVLHKLLESDEWKKKIATLITLLSIVKSENRYSELYDESRVALQNMMCATREELKELKNTNLKTVDAKGLKNSIEKEGGLTTENAEQLFIILSALDNNVRAVKEQNKNLMNEVKKYREESQILNWVIGEWCNQKNTPLKYLEEKDIVLFLGRELANYVDVYPGPFAAMAFLTKMLSKTKDYNNCECSLGEIINKLTVEDKCIILSEFQEYDLFNFPIAMAINESQRVDGNKEWYPLYKKRVGVSPEEVKRTCVEWAYQFYLECIAKMIM